MRKKRTFCINYLSLSDRAAAGFLRGFWILTKYLRISGRYLLEDLFGKHSTSSQPVNTGKGTRGVFVDGMSMLLKYNFCPTTKSQKLLDKNIVYFLFLSSHWSGHQRSGSSGQSIIVWLLIWSSCGKYNVCHHQGPWVAFYYWIYASGFNTYWTRIHLGY